MAESFGCGMIAGAKQAGLSSFVTADLLGFSLRKVSRVSSLYSEWCNKGKCIQRVAVLGAEWSC